MIFHIIFYMIKALPALGVNPVQGLSVKVKISVPADGGGKIIRRKSADCILNSGVTAQRHVM